MEELLDPNYGHSHRAFLQALMARGSVTFDEARPILAAIWTAGEEGDTEHDAEQVTEQEFHDYLDIARQAVSLFDYDIRTATHQKTKERIWAVVNTTSDPQTQLATAYTPDELAFIKRLLDAMFDTFNSRRMEVMALTQMQAMKLARPKRRQSQATQVDLEEGSTQAQQPIDRGLKHSEVEDVLASLIEAGWLERSREKFYSLTPRALLELRPWLVETYNDPDAVAGEWQRIKTCDACKDLITYGLRCGEPDCNMRLHDTCEDAYWRARGEKKCPKCSKEWAGDRYVGERAVTQTEAFQKGRRRSQAGGGASSLADQVMQENAEPEEDEDDEHSDDE